MTDTTPSRKPPPDRSWARTECVGCERPEHISPLRRLTRSLTRWLR